MLTFDLFRFPVQVHWRFAIVLLFVLDSELPLPAMALWAATVFLSILIHELGHAFTARRYGGQVDSVMIYAMGGLTTWRNGFGGIDRKQRVLVSASGFGLEIFVGLIVFAIAKQGVLGHRLVDHAHPGSDRLLVGRLLGRVRGLLRRRLWLGERLLGADQLDPSAGFDGSHMLREFMVKINPETGIMHSKVIGIVFAVLVAVILYQQGFGLRHSSSSGLPFEVSPINQPTPTSQTGQFTTTNA